MSDYLFSQRDSRVSMCQCRLASRDVVEVIRQTRKLERTIVQHTCRLRSNLSSLPVWQKEQLRRSFKAHFSEQSYFCFLISDSSSGCVSVTSRSTVRQLISLSTGSRSLKSINSETGGKERWTTEFGIRRSQQRLTRKIHVNEARATVEISYDLSNPIQEQSVNVS